MIFQLPGLICDRLQFVPDAFDVLNEFLIAVVRVQIFQNHIQRNTSRFGYADFKVDLKFVLSSSSIPPLTVSIVSRFSSIVLVFIVLFFFCLAGALFFMFIPKNSIHLQSSHGAHLRRTDSWPFCPVLLW